MNFVQFVSGNGAFDTRIRSGGDYDLTPLSDIYLMAFNPPSVPKEEGRWIIPSTYHQADARDHSVQRERGRFFALAGDIDTGNHSLEVLQAALDEIFGETDRIIYSTRSARESNRKWRFLVPLKYPISGTNYPDVQKYIGNRLLALDIECDQALARTGQLVFLPNRNTEFYEHDLRWTGCRFDASNFVHIVEFDREDRIRDEQAVKATGLGGYREVPQANVIAAFNRRFSVATLFKQYGYQQRGKDFRSPLQKGSSYATQIMENGRWVSLSTSDREIGHFNGEVTCGDAFDLFRYFGANNDWTEALKAASKLLFKEN